MRKNGLFNIEEEDVRFSKFELDIETSSEPTNEPFPLSLKQSSTFSPSLALMPDTKSMSYYNEEEEDKFDTKYRQSLASCQSISSSKTKSIKQTVRASLLIKEKSDFSVSDPVFTDHVTYTVKGKDSIGSFECSRRYNDFFHLRNALINRWPGTFVPKIPTKSSRKKDEKFIENRRYFLDRFMRKLEKQPHLLNSEEFKLFSRPTGEIDIMLSLLPKQDPDILIERYKTNLQLSDTIDENLVKQSKEEIEEFSIFAKNMIAVLKV